MQNEFKIYHFTKPDGTEYSGGMNSGVPSGFGIFKNNYGKEYRCQWKEGTIDGIANIIYVDGREFLGRYKNGQKYGVGKVTFGNKVYRGEFHQNQRTGSGELIEYESSELLSSEREFGYFSYASEMKAKYIKKGYYKNGRLNGFGINQVPLKNYTYIGMYADGSADGDGIEITSEGRYNGKFKRGLRHGPGEFQGEVSFRGYWSKGLKDKFGIERSAIGDEYEGAFEKGKKSGVGKFSNLDGVCYIGYFKKSMRSSFGKLDQNGAMYVGGFKENRKNGLGYVKESTEESYFGEWRNDMKDGLGFEVTLEDEYRGQFSNGMRSGKGILKRGGERTFVIYKSGTLHGRSVEDLSYLRHKFSKAEVDSFFISCRNKLDRINETLDEQRSQFEIDISFIKIDFKLQQKELKEKLLKNRSELSGLELTYKELIEIFERSMVKQMGRSITHEESKSNATSQLKSSLKSSKDKWEPMSFTPGKSNHGYSIEINFDPLKRRNPRISNDGETGRLMRSDYYTNMLKNSFYLQKKTEKSERENSREKPKSHTMSYYDDDKLFEDSIKKKLNFSQLKPVLDQDLESLHKSKLEVEMKAKALESARRRHIQVKRRIERNTKFGSSQGGRLDESIESLHNKNRSLDGHSSFIKKKKIMTPYKVPDPENSRRSILKGPSRSVFLDRDGFKDLLFFDDMMVLGGIQGVVVFSENYGSFRVLARSETISVSNLCLFEERRWIICLENQTKNLLILSLELDLISKIDINNDDIDDISSSSLFVKDNLCIWNSQNDIYMVDLYTQNIKKLTSFFEVKDSISQSLAFLANPRKQIILGYTKSLNSDNIYALYAEESTKIFKTTKILHISNRFSICQNFQCIAECGDRLFLVGGSASIDKKATRPFIILTNLDETMVPIEGKVFDEPGTETINCIKTLEDESGFTVCAGSKGYIYVFKVRNSSLILLQKYKLEESDFLADCINYYASNLYLVSNSYPEIKIIHMNNYKPTRPHSLSFCKWNIDKVYKELTRLNDEKLKTLCKRLKPVRVQKSVLDRYEEIVSFNLGNGERSEHLRKVVQNYFFKLMNKDFSRLGNLEIDTIICYEETIKCPVGIVKVLNGVESLICLDDTIIKSKFEFLFATYKPKSGNLFILEEPGDLLMISLTSNKLARAFDFVYQNESYKLENLTTTSNCLKVLGAFNNHVQGDCIFRIYERNAGVLTHHFPHLLDTCKGCETDFNQEFVFVIGKKGNFAVLTAFEFDKDMLFTCDFMRSDEDFISISRLSGTNLLVLATPASLLFLRYFEESFVLDREVKFDSGKEISKVDINETEIWIKFKGYKELMKFGLTAKDQKFNKGLMLENERKSKLEDDSEFLGGPIEGNFSKSDLARLFSSYDLEKEVPSIHEKVRLDISSVDHNISQKDSDNQATAKGVFSGGNMHQKQDASKLEKTMPKYGFDDSKKYDSDVEDTPFEPEKVLQDLDKLDSEDNVEKADEVSMASSADPEPEEEEGIDEEKINEMFGHQDSPGGEEKDDLEGDVDEDNYATFSQSNEDPNSKPHIPRIEDLENVSSQQSRNREKDDGSDMQTTKKNIEELHSATSHLPTNKPFQHQEPTPPEVWFKNYSVKEYVNTVIDDVVKIKISRSGKYIYLLTSIDGLMIAEVQSARLEPKTLTDEEIYNFFCLDDEVCIAFAVQRSSVFVFKGMKILNVVHSDDESLKNPFLTGISSYEPKFCKWENLRTGNLGFDKGIIEEINEESNNSNSGGEQQKGEGEEKSDTTKFLWMEGRTGVKYLEFDPKEMDCSTGELLTLWRNDRDYNDFIILAVEEVPLRNLILGLAFQDSADKTFLQIYDLNVKQSQSVYLRENEIFDNKTIMSMISMNQDRHLICSGSIKASPEDDSSDSLIQVITLEKNPIGTMQLKEQTVSVFTEYSKFWNLKKVNDFDFIACAEWDLLILRFETGTIYTCQIIEDLSDGIIYDACVFSNSIYAVSDDSKAICRKIDFDKEIPQETSE